ncbi:hypothetical protein BC938DRAFT_472684 [Jimgerdemannia flammicorona]|uniref:Uncharacterized protein n=1 Tax=Jimgerdemannia flammicorona TaxID=994334 RepID=A0A433Q5K6_9FUNG|nr:hypothetical protein BC938DRAFT_472684 [Jimgerdemannia flammicorona]
MPSPGCLVDESTRDASLFSRYFPTTTTHHTGLMRSMTMSPPAATTPEPDGDDESHELLLQAQGHYISHRFEKAVTLLKQAAKRGSVQAAVNLGAIYINGEQGKVPKDYPRACKWYLQALTLTTNATPINCTPDLLDIVQRFTDIFKLHQVDRDQNPFEWKQAYEKLRTMEKKLNQESDPVEPNDNETPRKEENYRRAIR